jgi:uncharacterized protein YgbK (DUF1537 family)
MTMLRLVADDLTRALDASAQFAGGGKVIPVFLGNRLPENPLEEFALDTASRETDGASAAAIASRTAHIVAPSRGSTSFKKVDSLLRGHPGAELAAVLRAIPGVRCVVAPAFPFHGRVTRGGHQYVRLDGAWHRTGEDLGEALESRGIEVRLMKPGEPVPAGTSLWDCETDEDLRRIARAGAELSEPLLWCGSGGLAAAISQRNNPWVAPGRIGRPLLGLFGSDHPVTAAQLCACGEDVLLLRDLGAANSGLVSRRLGDTGVCHVRVDLPHGVGRFVASARIAEELYELTRHVPQPGSLLVVGGETLRSLCLALATDHLGVFGQLMPGVPVSRMAGGLWDGTEVISKSGAFGGDQLLREIAARRGP